MKKIGESSNNAAPPFTQHVRLRLIIYLSCVILVSVCLFCPPSHRCASQHFVMFCYFILKTLLLL